MNNIVLQMKSNGNLIADDTIAVDLWSNNSKASLHFLTHLHADHIVGLSKYWHLPIYTSQINCKLAPLFIKGLDPSLLCPLPLNEETLIELLHIGYAKLYFIHNDLESLNHLRLRQCKFLIGKLRIGDFGDDCPQCQQPECFASKSPVLIARFHLFVQCESRQHWQRNPCKTSFWEDSFLSFLPWIKHSLLRLPVAYLSRL